MSAADFKVNQPIEKIAIGRGENSLYLGGQTTMPFLFSRGKIPHPPAVACEFWDTPPVNANFPTFQEKNTRENPLIWADFLTKNSPADLLLLKLMSPHPEKGSRQIGETADKFKEIIREISLPLIVTGCGSTNIDNQILPKIAKIAEGKNLLIGNATGDNYKEITKACCEFGHSLITESPIDINLAKQVNILVKDAGLPADRIVMCTTAGALGYGLEYAYSIMEKSRILGLEGDRYMNKPQIAMVGQETWRAKESKTGSPKAGILWETITAIAYLHAGADIVVVRHPQSAINIKEYINNFFRDKSA